MPFPYKIKVIQYKQIIGKIYACKSSNANISKHPFWSWGSGRFEVIFDLQKWGWSHFVLRINEFKNALIIIERKSRNS